MRVPIRVAVYLLACAVLTAQTPSTGQPPQVFRTGVELVALDVTALDSDGRQVTDLTPADFVVEVDGRARQVASADYQRLSDPLRIVGAPRPSPPARAPDYYSSNAKGAARGRLIVLLVDQGNIRTGAARAAMQSAKRFVDTLTPDDRVALMAIPAPGEMVDFTANHDAVREGLLRIAGSANSIQTRFNLSITEATALYMRSNSQVASEAVERECAQASSASDLERCEREVEQDAAEIVGEIRQRTDNSLRAMRQVLAGLAGIDGPKSVLLISEGLILDGLGGDVDDVATLAADARASLDVMLLDVPQFEASQGRQPTSPREDRERQVSGLEMLADAARGTLYRAIGTTDATFARLSRSLDGYYLLGVESRPDDRNGKRHKIAVRSMRRGVTLHSRRTFLTSMSAKATTPTDAVSRALRAPLSIGDLPLRLSTWTYKEPGSPRVRVLLTAEVERLANQPLDYTTGLTVVGTDGRGIAPAVVSRTLVAKEGDEGIAVYAGAVTVDPGTYRLRVALADSEGRVGTVDRVVTAYHVDGTTPAVGDLLLTGLNAAKRDVAPAIEPTVSTGQMAAFVEVYGPATGVPPGLDGVLDLLRTEDGPPLSSTPMQVAAGPSPEIAALQASVATAPLPPGRYLARTTIRHAGKPIGHLVRPFRVVAATAPADGEAAPVSGLPPDMTSLLLGAVPAFDRKAVLAPAALAPVLAAASDRGTAAAGALKEARAGDLGAAAMTALGDGDQALAAFLKGLDLLGQSQAGRAVVQLQAAMQLAPAFAPARLYLGVALADGNRHKEAAGLLQSAASSSPALAFAARLAGEEWIKAGQPALAIAPLEQALASPDPDGRTRRLLGLAQALGGKPADAAAVLAPYLETHPADHAALLAAIYGTYARHLPTPHAETLAADRDRAARWARAYRAAAGPMQPLVDAWLAHLQAAP